MFLLVISCKHKQEPKQSVTLDPNTAIYVADSIQYLELLSLSDDTLLDNNYTKKDIPIPILMKIGKHFHCYFNHFPNDTINIDTSKIGDIGRNYGGCTDHYPVGFTSIKLNKDKTKGVLGFCEGSIVSIYTKCFFRYSNKSQNQFFNLFFYPNGENNLDSIFQSSIKNKNVIVDKFPRR